MAVTCASRFSVLRLEDDDIFENKTTEKSQAQNKTKTANTKNVVVADVKTKPKKKRKSNDVAELQNLAFGNGTSKSKNKNCHNSTSKAATAKQWEEWKKKDNEFVSGAYEQDLEEALLLSKIDYEEKKKVYDAIQKDSEQKQNQKKKKKNNQKKEKGIMSLEEFQKYPSDIDIGSKGKADELDEFNSSPPKLPLPCEPDFFYKLNEDVEKIVNKEQKQDSFKKREDCRVPDIALSLEYQEKLARKDEEIKCLNDEITKLKTQLKTAKTRNKKLYDILAAGEMKEKAEILVEIQDLTVVKDELTEQLNEFHQSLEIERSKVHALQSELKKCQNSKKDRKES